MQGKLKRFILLIFIAFITIAAIIVYQVWNKPHRDVKDADAIKISAIDLYNDLASAKTSYVNKVVAVSGEVKEISKNQQNQQIILLKTGISGGYINCTMEENAGNIKAGSTIVLKGICSGYIGGDKDMDLPGDVFLIRCYYSS
jgi:hypothetical protein